MKCAACGARWHAKPEAPLELVPTPEATAPASETLPAEPDGAEGAAATPAGGDPAKVIRARVTTKRQVRELALSGMIWGGMVALLAAAVGAALILRVDVVRMWPRTATAYAAIGLPVNRVGLVIEHIGAEPSLQDGHAALSITGTIRNIEDHAIVSPPLRITLLNAAGKTVAVQIRRPAHPRVAPGGSLYFSSAILDPPLSAHDLEVAFALDVTGKTASTRALHAPAPKPAAVGGLRGAAAADTPAPLPSATVSIQPATPLPADSPHALPTPARDPAHHE